MDSRRDYLFGLISLVEGYIDASQLRDAMESWKSHPDRHIDEILTERDWLTEDARSTVEDLVKAELDRQPRESTEQSPASTAFPIESEPNEAVTRLQSPDSGEETVSHLAMVWYLGDQRLQSPNFGNRYRHPGSRQTGGMKEVFRVTDTKLGREVAIARVKPELVDQLEIVSRFMAEARITSNLEHPNIVPVHDLEELVHPPFYSMPYLSGRTLKQAIESHHWPKAGDPSAKLSLRQLLDNFLGVCNAIGFAHSKGVIHRDIKGANVQIDEFGKSIMLDWGLAKRLDSVEDPLGRETDPNESEDDPTLTYNPTRKGGAIGTVNYMPPEQANGELDRIGKHSDIFGLGTMLYTILAGYPPYQGRGTDTLNKAKAVAFELPSRFNAKAPKALENICLKAMQKEPEERYGTVETLAGDVKNWLADRPVSVFPEPISARAGRWMRKHQAIMAGAAMLLITAVVALSIGMWRVSVANRRTEIAADTAWQAIDQTLDIHEKRLSNIPGLQDVRLRMATSELNLASVLLGLHPDHPDRVLRVAAALNRVANLKRITPGAQDTILDYDKAIRLVDRLVKESPQIMSYRYRLAWYLVDRADANELIGQLPEAEADLTRALVHIATLEKVPPELRNLPQDYPLVPLATRARNQSAVIVFRLGRFDEAVEHAKAAIKAVESAIWRDDVQSMRLVLIQATLADSWRRLGDTKQAEEASLAALETAETLYIKAKDAGIKPDRDRSFIMAYASIERGWSLLKQPVPDAEKAEKHFLVAAEIMAELVIKFPEMASYWGALNAARSGRGTALAELAKRAGLSDQAEKLAKMAEINLKLATTEADKAVTLTHELQAHRGLALARLARWQFVNGQMIQAKKTFQEAAETLGMAQSRSPKDKVIANEIEALQHEVNQIWPARSKVDPDS